MVITGRGLPNSYNGFNAAAWKASKFPGNTSANRFPTLGQTIPANPDAGPQAIAANTYTLTTPTDEQYHVAIYDGSNKVVFHFLQNFEAPRYQAVPVYSGNVAPPSSLLAPDGSLFVNYAGGVGARLYISSGGVWSVTPL